MNPSREEIAVVGGGLVGSLLSVYLSRRGRSVRVYEQRPDLRRAELSGGRSINLVATSRGIEALRRVNLWEVVRERAVPVTGRMMHAPDGQLTYQPYGRDDGESNYSISRSELNEVLISEAEGAGARFHFQHRFLRGATGTHLVFLNEATGEEVELESPCVFAADGSSSAVRQELEKLPTHQSSYEDLGHGYKELLIPAGKSGSFRIDERALHIWPRGRFMMMALPNRDGSFTVTLYLPRQGDPSFASLQTPEAVTHLFEEVFSDAIPLIPDLEQEFFENPTGHLGTVRCQPWHHDDRVLLIGDSAHAIVPFFGQGMNCGFEGCTVLDELIGRHPEDWSVVFESFSRNRKPDADAIADMAIENFVEMSERVADPVFLLRKQVEHRLENEMPLEYRSRYSMVAYSLIPYAVAQQAGRLQAEIMSELLRGIERADQVDFDRARTLIRARLTPYLDEQGVSLDY